MIKQVSYLARDRIRLIILQAITTSTVSSPSFSKSCYHQL